MDGRVEITEEEVWREIDKWFTASGKDEDEYEVSYFMNRYGKKRSATISRLTAMQKAGALTSRKIVDNGTWKRVWKFSGKVYEESESEE